MQRYEKELNKQIIIQRKNRSFDNNISLCKESVKDYYKMIIVIE